MGSPGDAVREDVGSIATEEPTQAGSVNHSFRPAWAEIDLAALRHNVEVLRKLCAPAGLSAVVKADGYGHGAVEIAQAAMDAGAVGVAVALVEEGVELREAGFTHPILLLSEPPLDAAGALVGAGVYPTIYSARATSAVADEARRLGTQVPIHVKVDTGMHRVGAEPRAVRELVQSIADDRALKFEGLWTHLAVAEGQGEEDRTFTQGQIERFATVVAELRAADLAPEMLHAANSAGAIGWPAARYDLVRCGIAIYGELPTPEMAAAVAAIDPTGLRPVMSVKTHVSALRELEAGARPSYGRRRPLPERSIVATVPLGYADGVPRALFEAGFEVLIGGRRRPLAGTVTMDQTMVDCGLDRSINLGDEVVFLGRQGDDVITAGEWAQRLGTISYEVLTGIGPRVPRRTINLVRANPTS